MKIYPTIIFLLCYVLTSFGQQQILLIGTHHQTSSTHLKDFDPINDALVKFNPQVICTEYRIPTDSASLIYLYGEKHFIKQDSLRKAWNLPASKNNSNMERLRSRLKSKDNPFDRMILRNLLYVQSDMGNADYHTYLLMKSLEADSSQIDQLRKQYPMFDQVRQRYKRRSNSHDEYNTLVFPLAKKLNVDYLYPIDDQSANVDYEKYFAKLNDRDTTILGRKAYYKRINTFLAKASALPENQNTWLFANTPETINDLMYVEAYKVDPTTDSDVLNLNKYFTLRNRIMATHIVDVVKRNAGKRVVVFFGASHVGPIREELKQAIPEARILTFSDVSN